MRKVFLAVLLLAAAAPPLAAQVGSLPEESPYRDLRFRREWTFFTGIFDAQRDPEGVAPRGGPLAGGRFDMRLAGPAYLSARVALAFLDRRILDPRQPEGQRFVGEDQVRIMLSDVSLGLNLTGFRTWRNLVPTVSAGLGFAADLAGSSDVGDYRFGAPFTMNFGAGMKYVLGGRWQLRADWVNYIYQIKYPEQYYIDLGDGDPVRGLNQPRDLWRRNTSFQIGLSWLTGR